MRRACSRSRCWLPSLALADQKCNRSDPQGNRRGSRTSSASSSGSRSRTHRFPSANSGTGASECTTCRHSVAMSRASCTTARESSCVHRTAGSLVTATGSVPISSRRARRSGACGKTRGHRRVDDAGARAVGGAQSLPMLECARTPAAVSPQFLRARAGIFTIPSGRRYSLGGRHRVGDVRRLASSDASISDESTGASDSAYATVR